MPEYGLHGRKRIAAGILAFLTLSVILFSTFFIAFEAHHDCTGEDDCCICSCIEQCTKAMLQVRFGYWTAVQTAVALFLFLLTVISLGFVTVFRHETLVSSKVRLND